MKKLIVITSVALILSGVVAVYYRLANYRHSHPKIVLRNGMITVNGRELSLPTTLPACKTIFGEPTRSLAKLNTIHVWDDVGIYCYANPTDQKVNEFVLAFQHEDFDFGPLHLFPGTLSIDGVTVPRSFTTAFIAGMNGKLSGPKFTRHALLPFLWERQDAGVKTTLKVSNEDLGQEVILFGDMAK